MGQRYNPKEAEILFERKALEEQYQDRWNFSPYTDNGEWLNWKQDALKKLELKKEDRILDYGSATCEVSEWLAAQGYNVLAVDICHDLLLFSQHRAKKYGYEGLLQYHCADCEQLPFEDDVFDKVFCFDVLHHLPSPKKGVSEIYRVLKAGGKALAYEPNALSPVRRIYQLKWKESSLEKSFYPWALYRMFNKRFSSVGMSFDQRPLNPWNRQGKRLIPSIYLRLARTRLLSPFLSGIMCIAQK
ncbi:class I SAM-dependent methyltransferase [Chloroflexota bacterium]